MAGSQAVTLVAEKYVPEVVAGIERPLDYRDARVEAGRITVKTTEMDPKLGGWIGYAFSVNTKGKLTGPTAVVTGEPGISTFLDWAKRQSVKELRRYLAANGITATGDIVFMLAYRLTYLYEEAWHKRHETWPLDPGRMEARQRKVAIINKLINMKGVGTHPDEDAAAKQLLIEDGKIPWNLIHREESPVADAKPEKRSDVLKRLRAQAAGEEAAGTSPEKGTKGKGKGSQTETETPPETEAAAVKAGKGKRKGAAAAHTEQPPAASAADTEEETGVSKKSAKGKKAKAGKAESKPAAKPKAEKKGNVNAKAKDFPLESKVKYVGTRVKHHIGKTGTVVGHIGDVGLKIKWSDGLVATATAMSLEKVK